MIMIETQCVYKSNINWKLLPNLRNSPNWFETSWAKASNLSSRRRCHRRSHPILSDLRICLFPTLWDLNICLFPYEQCSVDFCVVRICKCSGIVLCTHQVHFACVLAISNTSRGIVDRTASYRQRHRHYLAQGTGCADLINIAEFIFQPRGEMATGILRKLDTLGEKLKYNSFHCS